ncbi:MAG: hypothetical protein J0M12_13690 [Deltaproteobacteria bacterium]|nr:hypothetical protein [Deltaproteobacteria bacterium]
MHMEMGPNQGNQPVVPARTEPLDAAPVHIQPTPAADPSLEGTTLGMRAVLSLADFRSCRNLSEISERYKQTGFTFSNQAELLQQIAKDWNHAREAAIKTARSSPLPSEFPVDRLTVDGKNYALLGILHSVAAHPDSIVLLRTTLNEFPFPLAEQNLGILNFGLHSSGLDIPDHHTEGMLAAVLQNEVNSFKFFVRTFREASPKRAAARRAAETQPSNAETELGKHFGRFQSALGIRNPIAEQFSRDLLFIPVDLMFEPTPTGVRVELMEQNGQRLPRTTARSAYMAEFLRQFNPEQALRHLRDHVPEEVLTRAYQETAFVCGKGHVEEIRYFLENGVKDSRIRNAAIRDAQLLNDDLRAFLESITRRERTIRNIGFALAIGKGLALGGAVAGIIQLL